MIKYLYNKNKGGIKMRFMDYVIGGTILGLLLGVLAIPYFILNAIFNKEEEENLSIGFAALTIVGYFGLLMLMGAN